MILCFDLDEVLYDEISFVKSGLNAVSEHLSKQYSISRYKSKKFLETRLSEGRENILDDLLKEFGLFSRKRVKECLSVYRLHKPRIKLYKEADICLRKFKQIPIYIVTDGNKIVQKNKILSLGLQNRVKFCFITSNYGLNNAKPSPYCFLKICKIENVKPLEIVYIGDDPNKDFVGIKPHGFRTIRLLKGKHRNLKKPAKFEAEYTIKSLSEINFKFLKNILDNKIN